MIGNFINSGSKLKLTTIKVRAQNKKTYLKYVDPSGEVIDETLVSETFVKKQIAVPGFILGDNSGWFAIFDISTISSDVTALDVSRNDWNGYILY